tara:strand:+ start:8007 stop:8924 length:918 start_codon:yes stop_codon:yes gene_type:complete
MKIGVIGCADIFKRKWLDFFLENKSIELVGVARRMIDKDEKRFVQIEGYKKFKKNQVDIVYITLPNSLHYEIAKHYLNKGINVWVEKPTTISLKRTVELINIAKKNNLFVFESLQWKYHRRTLELKKIIKNDRPYLIEVIFTIPRLSSSNIRYNRKLSGGACLDLGSYPCSVISTFFPDEDFELLNIINFKSEKKKIDMGASGSFISSKGDLIVKFYYSFDKCYQSTLSIHSRKGKFTVNQPFTIGNKVEAIITNDYNTDLIEFKFSDCHYKKLLNYILDNPDKEQINNETLKQAETLNKLILRL